MPHRGIEAGGREALAPPWSLCPSGIHAAGLAAKPLIRPGGEGLAAAGAMAGVPELAPGDVRALAAQRAAEPREGLGLHRHRAAAPVAAPALLCLQRGFPDEGVVLGIPAAGAAESPVGAAGAEGLATDGTARGQVQRIAISTARASSASRMDASRLPWAEAQRTPQNL